MLRCYVCRRLASLTKHRGASVCKGCENAVARVIELEVAERFLTERLMLLRDTTGEQVTRRRCEDAIEKVGSPYKLDRQDVTRVLTRIVDVLDPTAGKGHALETLSKDHQRTVGSQQSITYACIMPGCEVCAVVGAARELLRSMTL